MVADSIEKNISGTGKRCFEAGLGDSPYRSNHFRDFCDGMRPKEPWLGKSQIAAVSSGRGTVLYETLIRLAPDRDLSRVLYCLDTNVLYLEHQSNRMRIRPDDMWACHIGLSGKNPIGVRKSVSNGISTYHYQNSIIIWIWGPSSASLDAGLQVLAEKGAMVKELGSCWNVLSQNVQIHTGAPIAG